MATNTDGIALVSRGVGKTLGQMGDPAFISVVFKSAVTAVIALIVLLWSLGQFWPEGAYLTDWIFGADTPSAEQAQSGTPEGSTESASENSASDEEEEGGWLSETFSYISGFFYWFTVVLAFYLLFPSLMTMIIGIFLDDITDAVEAKHYPHKRAYRKVGVVESAQSALVLGIKLLCIHLILFIPYVILSLLGLGLVAVLLFLAINTWAYGQEYFTMVAARHLPPRDAKRLYQQYRGQVLTAGLGIAGLFLVPFLNLLAPVLGVALMTHLAHDLLSADQ